MKNRSSLPKGCARRDSERGSVLVTALILSIVLAVSLISYLKLSTTSLKMAHRTYFADAAANLAETGLEEAVWAFNTMGNSGNASVIAAAWGNWTVGNTIGDFYMSSMGTNYTSAPSVSISGGGGTGATGTASIGTVYTVVGNTTTAITGVSKITVTNAGSGYTAAPTVVLSGGGGTGAIAVARLAATRTWNFPNLDQNATGNVKVWVAGYNGTTNVPIIVAKATITPVDGPPIEKYVKVILSKNGMLPKGVVAKQWINWNGHPFADSYVSSTSPGVPPYAAYNVATARAHTTVAALTGPTIDLAQGTVNGNVMTGPGVTVTGGTVNGQQIGNFQATISLPTYPTYSGATGQYNLGSVASLPGALPRGTDTPAGDGKYYYFCSGTTIGNTTISTGKDVVIVGNASTCIRSGLQVAQGNTTVGGVTTYTCGNATIYMDGNISLSGNDAVNTGSWAGALKIYTSTTSDCTFSGNAQFYGCLTAPNSKLEGNGGGNDQADLCGSFVVNQVRSNGHMNFHYDEGLNDLTTGKPWSLSLWTELQTAADRATYASKFNF